MHLLEFVESFDTPEQLKEIASVLKRNYMISSLKDGRRWIHVEIPNEYERAKKIGAEKGLTEDEIERLEWKLAREKVEKELGVTITPRDKKLRERWGLLSNDITQKTGKKKLSRDNE